MEKIYAGTGSGRNCSVFEIDPSFLPPYALETVNLVREKWKIPRKSLVLQIFYDHDIQARTYNVHAFWPATLGLGKYTKNLEQYVRFEAKYRAFISAGDFRISTLKDYHKERPLSMNRLLRLINNLGMWEPFFSFGCGRDSKVSENDEKGISEDITLSYDFHYYPCKFLEIFSDEDHIDCTRLNLSTGSCEAPLRTVKTFPELKLTELGRINIYDYDEIIKRAFPTANLLDKKHLEWTNLTKMVENETPKILSAMSDFVEN
jgi:hypothetical protein